MSVNTANVLRCWICEFPANGVRNMHKIRGKKVYLCSQDCHKIFIKSITANVETKSMVIQKARKFNEIEKKEKS